MSFPKTYLLLLICLMIGLGSANRIFKYKNFRSKIVGGFETTIEENPWQVALLLDGKHRCGGSIIGERWVLTASHCTYSFYKYRMSVRVGSTDNTIGGLTIGVKNIYMHQKYDFCLLKLSKSLTFSKSIQPIALPNEDTPVEDGTLCLTSGWGRTLNVNETNIRLRAVYLPIVNQVKCNEQYEGTITDAMICAGYEDGGKDSCNGDSGGPLVKFDNGNAQLIGVVSFGYNQCADPEHAGVYARVTAGRSWIKKLSGI